MKIFCIYLCRWMHLFKCISHLHCHTFFLASPFAFDLNKIRWLWCIVALCRELYGYDAHYGKGEGSMKNRSSVTKHLMLRVFFSFANWNEDWEEEKKFFAEQEYREKPSSRLYESHYKSVVCDKLSWIIRTLFQRTLLATWRARDNNMRWIQLLRCNERTRYADNFILNERN